jgi:hypothetical protein
LRSHLRPRDAAEGGTHGTPSSLKNASSVGVGMTWPSGPYSAMNGPRSALISGKSPWAAERKS